MSCGDRGAQQMARLLAVLCLLAAAVAPARAATCRWSIRRRSGWTGLRFPLSIAELSVVDAATGLPVFPSFAASSNWGPQYTVESLIDGNAATFWATANNDLNPSLNITWDCGGSGPYRLVLTNRQLASTTYNNCNQDCVNRLSSFSVYEETNANGDPLVVEQFENPLMWWSPRFYPSPAEPPATNALLPLPWASSTRTITVYAVDEGERNCFMWIAPTEPRANTIYINLNELVWKYSAAGSRVADTVASSSMLYASMSANFRGFEVGKCFDGSAASTCASTNSSAPGPRMVIAGPCGIDPGEETFLKLDVRNRPSSSPGCVGCSDRISKFTFTASRIGWGPPFHNQLGGSFDPPTALTVPVPATFSFSASFEEPGCFAGTSLVEVFGQASPVALQDVRVGDKLRCFDTDASMLQPTTPKWCEVVSWAHSDPRSSQFYELSYTQGGSAKSLKLSPLHLVYVLTSATAGATAASVAGLGSYQLKIASDVRAGDLIAVQAGAGFAAAAVTSAVRLAASLGYYVPALDEPFILVNGVVAPLWVGGPFPGGALPAWQLYPNVLPHIINSPIWMARQPEQPVGTAGKDAAWDAAKAVRVWPGAAEMGAQAIGQLAQGYRLDAPGLISWFSTREAAWRANPAAAISLTEVKQALATYLTKP